MVYPDTKFSRFVRVTKWTMQILTLIILVIGLIVEPNDRIYTLSIAILAFILIELFIRAVFFISYGNKKK